jgi:HD-like signal output (HDOD) protein
MNILEELKVMVEQGIPIKDMARHIGQDEILVAIIVTSPYYRRWMNKQDLKESGLDHLKEFVKRAS